MVLEMFGQAGFGVTYEGLKLRFSPLSSSIHSGFGVTYEGLKPSQPRLRRSDIYRFWSYL